MDARNGNPTVETIPNPAAAAISAGVVARRFVESGTARRPPPMSAMPPRSSGRRSSVRFTRPAANIATAVTKPKAARTSDARARERSRTFSA
jgi:hypothetical protein